MPGGFNGVVAPCSDSGRWGIRRSWWVAGTAILSWQSYPRPVLNLRLITGTQSPGCTQQPSWVSQTSQFHLEGDNSKLNFWITVTVSRQGTVNDGSNSNGNVSSCSLRFEGSALLSSSSSVTVLSPTPGPIPLLQNQNQNQKQASKAGIIWRWAPDRYWLSEEFRSGQHILLWKTCRSCYVSLWTSCITSVLDSINPNGVQKKKTQLAVQMCKSLASYLSLSNTSTVLFLCIWEIDSASKAQLTHWLTQSDTEGSSSM